MSAKHFHQVRWGCASSAGVLAAVALFFAFSTATPVPADAPFMEPILRVEEDWVLVLNEPDGSVDSPQFHTVMSPFSDVETYFAQVLWNYREEPDYISGGVQLQSYDGETLVRGKSMEFGQLSTTAETVSWTQSLETNGTSLSFSISNGQSTTWGVFGKDMYIATDAALASLNNYNPDFSAQASGITYGSNRVNTMTITQVRYYGASGLLGVDATPRVVSELSSVLPGV